MSDAFADLGLAPALAAGLAGLGYEEPTPIQREAIPPLLAGRDLLGQAATGTGKTAAFALPLLQRLAAAERRRGPAARRSILVPTRELAMQVAEAVHRYGRAARRHASCRSTAARRIEPQLRALERGVRRRRRHAGPRARPSSAAKTLDLDGVAAVVLDEADEMLDMGFAEDIEAILRSAPGERQTALFSATHPRRASRRSPSGTCSDPVAITIARETTAAGHGAAGPADGLHRARARTSWRRSAACSTSRRPTLGASSSAARAPRSTSWPRRSPAAATAPKRCTAA